MRRLAAALIVAVALWPAVIASTATADIPPGNPATPTPTIEPFPTDTPTPSPEPAPSPTPIPLTVTGANGVVFLGGVYQTGSDHYTITAKAPTDLPGTWDLVDNYYGGPISAAATLIMALTASAGTGPLARGHTS